MTRLNRQVLFCWTPFVIEHEHILTFKQEAPHYEPLCELIKGTPTPLRDVDALIMYLEHYFDNNFANPSGPLSHDIDSSSENFPIHEHTSEDLLITPF